MINGDYPEKEGNIANQSYKLTNNGLAKNQSE